MDIKDIPHYPLFVFDNLRYGMACYNLLKGKYLYHAKANLEGYALWNCHNNFPSLQTTDDIEINMVIGELYVIDIKVFYETLYTLSILYESINHELKIVEVNTGFGKEKCLAFVSKQTPKELTCSFRKLFDGDWVEFIFNRRRYIPSKQDNKKENIKRMLGKLGLYESKLALAK